MFVRRCDMRACFEFQVADALVTHIGQPSDCSELCSCAGSATIKQTADQSWNNSEVRCVAKNASGVILSSSAFTMIQLSNTGTI
ncbi:hypothetical protein DPMN_138641 [Dreissena polymorpha]|uniref:Uncharacterized protein n=1 Tax=Dreissena polymorpha TaxID=45954 RepID=A0A9D4G7K1_DREPO|nr:hypothetical protein DPMN_138641 [Dreissena polymorpha]